MISSYVTQNWITVIIVFLIALLVLLHFLYKIRFVKFISIIKTKEYFVDYINKGNSFVSLFNGVLFLFQLGIYALFVYLIKMSYRKLDNGLSVFLDILSMLFLFIIGRYLIGKVISYILGIDKIQGILSFVKFTYFSKVAIYLFPLVIVLFYIPYYQRELLMGIMSLAVAMLLYFYGKLLLQNQKIIFRNLFYFILYLCTLEIIPLVYLYKTIF
jgi:hypothetical protein